MPTTPDHTTDLTLGIAGIGPEHVNRLAWHLFLTRGQYDMTHPETVLSAYRTWLCPRSGADRRAAAHREAAQLLLATLVEPEFPPPPPGDLEIGVDVAGRPIYAPADPGRDRDPNRSGKSVVMAPRQGAAVTVSTWQEMQVTGAGWETVVKAFTSARDFAPGFANVDGDWRERVYRTMQDAGIWSQADADPKLWNTAPDRVILMATNPGFGAVRDWTPTPTAQPPTIEDPLGGWLVLDDRAATYLRCESGSSGSSITAAREPAGTWTLTGSFPVRDGEVYRGVYFETFAAAVGADTANLLGAAYTYHVEIRHAGTQEWVHIHHPDWETSTCFTTAFAYARRVLADHGPTSRVRVVEKLEGHPDHHIEVR